MQRIARVGALGAALCAEALADGGEFGGAIGGGVTAAGSSFFVGWPEVSGGGPPHASRQAAIRAGAMRRGARGMAARA